MIPQPAPGERGYLVSDSGVIHLRYADHAQGAIKVASVKGVLNVLAGKEPKTCKVCFPHGNRQRPDLLAKPGQKRRA